MKHLFVLACIFLLGQAFSQEKKLLFVQIILRHGDRTPLRLYPNDPNPHSVWREGLKALTTLGKKQQYALGKYFRSRYDNFVTSSPLEVNVISTGIDWCLMSAESNLASFYAPDSEWSFDSSLPWQPIPIHYVPESQDKYLSAKRDCPRADEEQKRVFQSPENQKVFKEHEEMFKVLSSLSGYTIDDWTKAFLFHDVLLIEKIHNLTVPTWVEPYWDELTKVAGLSFFWRFNSPLLHRLRAGPLIQKIIQTMDQKINGEIPKLKFQIYSTKQTILALVLAALNQYNMIQPPYASALLFELFEMPDGAKTVRILYQNSSKPEEKIDPPQVLILEGCTEYCPLDYFVSYTSFLMPDNWDVECQLPKSFFEKLQDSKFTILIVVIAALNAFLLWRMYVRRQDKYAYQPMQ